MVCVAVGVAVAVGAGVRVAVGVDVEVAPLSEIMPSGTGAPPPTTMWPRESNCSLPNISCVDEIPSWLATRSSLGLEEMIATLGCPCGTSPF